MKKTKQPRSSDKDNNKQNTKNKKKNQSSSVIYDHSNLRKSLGTGSPKINKFSQKYKSYMQFITSNKICPDLPRNITNPLFSKKNTATSTPRKNSPIPYHKGRKSAFSRLISASPTHDFIESQRSSLPKTARAEYTNINQTFYINGCNMHQRKISNQSRKLQKSTNQKQRQSKQREKAMKETSKEKGQSWFQKRDQQKRRSPYNNMAKNQGKKAIKSKDKKKQKSSINRSSLDSDRGKTAVQDIEEQKLFEKSFKGIQFYRDLGKGAHALVKSAVDWNNKRKIAIKIYEKDQLTEEELNSIEREIEILHGLTHTNIIKLYDIIETFKTINLVMEYGGGNSLEQYIKSKPEGTLSQKQAKQIFQQTLDAVGYLHKMHITHRDIKTDNILLNKHLSLKIIDFGFSLICPPNKTISSYCGTPTYMAPEVVSKTPHNPQLADRWSLGILLYTVLNGHCPFRASTQKDLFQKIIKGQFQYNVEVSLQAKDLISKFLQRNPNQRINPYDALKHPWFNS